jgi:hypothetical protein
LALKKLAELQKQLDDSNVNLAIATRALEILAGKQCDPVLVNYIRDTLAAIRDKPAE